MALENQVLSVRLPAGAEPPFRVYVNGEEWTERTDFAVDGALLRFLRPLRARPKLGFGRSLMLAMGIGVYGDLKGDQLDIQYRSGTQTLAASMPLTAGEAAESPPPG
jgi:hypothetical protein